MQLCHMNSIFCLARVKELLQKHFTSVLPLIPESLYKVTVGNSWLLKEIVSLHQKVIYNQNSSINY